MRIVNFDDDTELEDIPSLQIIIKAVPFEKSYVPSLVIMSPAEEYQMSIDELNALMDGVEIAKNKIDEIITYILKIKIFDENGIDRYKYNPEDFEDFGEVEYDDEGDEE
jgi:hypothetical protein